MPHSISKPEDLLTPRQLEVLELLTHGLTNSEIADSLGISTSTAKLHVSAIIKALDVTNRTEAVGALRASEIPSIMSSSEGGFPGFGDRSAIAVLPLENLSRDGEPDVVADGLVEDLINGLAAFRWFPVITRSTSFSYRNRGLTVPEIAKELGVRYVVEGSVRTSGERLRIQVQLVEARRGRQICTLRYDHELNDMLAVQDQIATAIVGALAPQLLRVEGVRALRQKVQDTDAWTHFQRGMALLYSQMVEPVREAINSFEAALAEDDSFAAAHAGLSLARFVGGLQMMGLTRRKGGDIPAAVALGAYSLQQAVLSGRRAVELDPMDPVGHLGLGIALATLGDTGKGVASCESAVNLNPSSAFCCWALGDALMLSGRWQEAANWIHRALRLSPRDPYIHHFHGDLGAVHLREGDLVLAIRSLRQAVLLQPPSDPFTHRPLLIASLALEGRVDESRQELFRLQQEDPFFNLELDRTLMSEDMLDQLAKGLAIAGWKPITP